MQQNNRTNEKTFLNTVKEPIAYNLHNIFKISSGLCKHTSWECLYNLERLFEYGLESLCDRWYCKLVFFYKMVKGLPLSYLQSHFLIMRERIILGQA